MSDLKIKNPGLFLLLIFSEDEPKNKDGADRNSRYEEPEKDTHMHFSRSCFISAGSKNKR